MTHDDGPRVRFSRVFADGVFLSADDPQSATSILRDAGLESYGPVATVEPAGQGNMNLVLRAETPGGSVVIKQARPWVEKYPQIDAPIERAAVEAAFYRAVADTPDVASSMPRLLGEARASGAVVLEDLGDAEPLDGRYRGEPLTDDILRFVCTYSDRVHGLTADDRRLTNRAMRRLNHAHIFVLPLEQESDVDLDAITPGLAECAERLRSDDEFVRRVRTLGETYLDDGPCLLHGDLHPGSVLDARGGLKVIDPEFTLPGWPTFEFGVIVAHAVLSGRDAGEVLTLAKVCSVGELDERETLRFAGVEIVRRLIGVAQVPLAADLGEKAAFLDEARQWVLA